MTLPGLAWRYLWARPLVAALNLVMLALGVAAMVFVSLTSEQIDAHMRRGLQGIDLVVGAKSSPLQLILAGVFHLDAPSGNIPLAALQALRDQPLVARAVPLSLGDNLRGFRIVGTEPAYLQVYDAVLREGQLWQAPLQAVLGAEVATSLRLAPGARFNGSHGLSQQGPAHAQAPYTVSGVLAPCACVLDRLVLTSLESVWAVHEPAHESAHTGDDKHDDDERNAQRELSLLLVSYRSPLAAMSLPRWVNAQPALQAAAPALESARLLRMVGVGVEVLRGAAGVLLAVAALSVFVALTHAVREREADLAMLRMLGARAARIAALPLLEALWLAALGFVLGLLLGHAMVYALSLVLREQQSLPLTAAWWTPTVLLLAAGVLVLAAVAALVPSWRCFRLDVTRLLQAPR